MDLLEKIYRFFELRKETGFLWLKTEILCCNSEETRFLNYGYSNFLLNKPQTPVGAKHSGR